MSHRDRANASRQWDAGEAGCGRLILGLQSHVRELAPGETLEVIARDAAAWIDLPAWCRMTGHALITEAHPVYVIRKKVT